WLILRFVIVVYLFLFFSSRRRHTRWPRDWSSDVCSSDLFLALRRGIQSCFCPCLYYYSARHWSLYGYRRGEQRGLTPCRRYEANRGLLSAGSERFSYAAVAMTSFRAWGRSQPILRKTMD